MYTGLYIFIVFIVILILLVVFYTIWQKRKDTKRMNTMR